jgi:hypothetical protein
MKCMRLIEYRFRQSLNRGQIWLRGFGIFYNIRTRSVKDFLCRSDTQLMQAGT